MEDVMDNYSSSPSVPIDIMDRQFLPIVHDQAMGFQNVEQTSLTFTGTKTLNASRLFTRNSAAASYQDSYCEPNGDSSEPIHSLHSQPDAQPPSNNSDCKMQIEVENKVSEEGHNFDDGSAEGNAKHQVSVAAPIKVASQMKRKKCVAEAARVHKVLEELSAKSATADHVAAMRYKRQRISNDARVLLVEYARELSSAILEESCLLARHRSSKELIIADLKLIFGKKFGVDVSGYQPRSSRVTDTPGECDAEEDEAEESDEEKEIEVKVEEPSTVPSVHPVAEAKAAADSANTGEPIMAVETDTAASHRPAWENHREGAVENQYQNVMGQRDARYNAERELPAPVQDTTRHFAGYPDSSQQQHQQQLQQQPSDNRGDFPQYGNMKN